MRVLVVDDRPDMTDSLAAPLGLWGHESAAANDGATALSLAAGFRPDVALVNVLMPGCDGWEAARGLRALPGLGRLVVVALTGWTGPLQPGRQFDFKLLKPVEPADLRLLLEACDARSRLLIERGELARGAAQELRRRQAAGAEGGLRQP